MNRKALVGGLAILVIGVLSGACAAPEGEEEESSDGALSVGECNVVGYNAKQKHLASCTSRFDVAKAAATYTACVQGVRKPFDDETKTCNDALAAANAVSAELAKGCDEQLGAKSCGDLFRDTFDNDATEASLNAALQSKDPAVKKNAEETCKSIRARTITDCKYKAAKLSNQSDAAQKAAAVCDNALEDLFDSVRIWWGTSSCQSAKDAVTRGLESCKTTQADWEWQKAFSACRKECPGQDGTTCTPPEYADRGYACGIIQSQGGWVRAKTCECVAQSACKEYDTDKKVEGQRCKVSTAQACAANDASPDCNGTFKVTLGTKDGKPASVKLCVK